MNVQRTISLSLFVCAHIFVRSQCMDSTVIWIDTDFELNDGGLVPDNAGNWEYGVIDTTLTGAICTSLSTDPPGAFSGTKGWATDLNDCYLNSGTESILSLTLDLSPPNLYNAKLVIMQWHEVFVNFDYLQVKVNGNVEFFNDTLELSLDWYETTIELDAYLGGMVLIEFELFASTQVNRAGWYLDDLRVTACHTGATGLQDIAVHQFSISPNPASDLLECYWSGSLQEGGSIAVHNMSGVLIDSHNISAGNKGTISLNVEQLEAGVYLLVLERNEKRYFQKFIKL